MTFGGGKLAKLVLAAAAFIAAEQVLFLTDVAIVGRVLGPHALGVMALISPMYLLVTAISVIFAFGVSSLRLGYLAETDDAAAARMVRIGIFGSVVIGFVLLGFATLIEDPYLNLFSPDKSALVFFDDYWGWFSLTVLFKSFGCMIFCLVYSDGAKRLAFLAFGLHLLVNLFVAYALSTGRWFDCHLGMEGISLGTCIAYIAGLIVLSLRFLDWRHCRIRLTSSGGRSDSGAKSSLDSRYEVLRGSQMTLGDLDGVIELDRISLDSCYQVSAGDDYLLFKDNPENGLIIRDRGTKMIVGYSMLLPIRQDMYEKIKSGTFVDTDFRPEMTFKYDKPGIYHLYFASIVVHPDHRSAALVLTMLDAMVEDFIRLAKRGIWFRDMIADVVSNDGAKFCRLFGLKKVCDTNHNSAIYEVSGLPPGIRETTPSTKRLVRLYRRKHESV